MIRTAIKTTATIFFFLLFVVEMSVPKPVLGDTCSEGTGVPPFVGTDAVDPNILLMIDNSASMYDLAAVGETGICYDGTETDDDGNIVAESYDVNTVYSGYFRTYIDPPLIEPYLEDTWYSYDLVRGRFEKVLDSADILPDANDQHNEPEARALCGNTGKVFSGDDVCVKYNPEYTGPGDTDPPVLAFAARGNFLNWLSASKLDIQKKVLTGGKVNESTNELELIMESRGCLNHRYVKKTVGVDLTGDITGLVANSEAYLTLGIRIPAEWQNGISYPPHSVVVAPPGCREDNSVECVGYYTSAGGTSSGTSPQNDSVTWEERDYADLTQIEVFKVTTGGFDVSGCEDAIAGMAEDPPNLGQIKSDMDVCLAAVGGLTTLEAASNAILNQSTQDCWYMQKHPELWNTMGDSETISTENMSNIRQGCEAVYKALEAQNKTLTDITPTDTGYACYGYNYTNEAEESVKGGYVGRCWEQALSVNCEEETCPDGMLETGAERICRGGIVYECPDNNWKGGQCKNKGEIIPEEKYTVSVICTGETSPGKWENVFVHPGTGEYCLNEISNPSDVCIGLGGFNEINGCIQQALEDYCGNYTTPEVIDPSDVEGSVSGDYYNIPAILIETAVNAQLDESLMAMNGRIQTEVVPEGILEQNAAKFRFGAMAFNDKGQKTECQLPDQDSVVVRDCTSDSQDGARVISYLDIDAEGETEHINQITGAINDIKGTTWTPLAEAMYTAIGYFSQNPDMRLNPSDFLVQDEVDAVAPAWDFSTVYTKGDKVTHGGNSYIANSTGTSCAAVDTCVGPDSDDLLWVEVDLFPAVADPIEAYCQSNNVIYITEGASTVDIAADVTSFVEKETQHDDDTDPDSCGKFNGSSYLDDLTWYGWQGNMWSSITDKENYSNIRTWVVESAPRQITGVSGECQPSTLLTDAAKHGSLIVQDDTSEIFTEKMVANNEVEFREKLQSAFDTILDRVSSGSAASVISASRSGEGALYQAIFWPDKDSGRVDAVTGEPIFTKWTGEVHAFLVDSQGILYMDNCKDDTTGCQTGGLDEEAYDSDNDGVVDSFLDIPIVVYGDEIGQTDSSGSSATSTKGCPGSLINGEIVFFDKTDRACLKTPRALEHIEYLWSTSDWLNRDDVDDVISYNRLVDVAQDYEFIFSDAESNPDKRFVFTWNDLDNDGVVDDSEMREFEPGLPELGDQTEPVTIPDDIPALPSIDPAQDRGPVPVDFGVDPREADAENQVNNIIKWIRGEPVTGMRDRLVSFDKNESGAIEADEYAVWKLGDVIHSTPVSVSSPAENYHQLYRDNSYGEFLTRWEDRRHIIYFGANDGMLHAVNGGFFDEENNRFCREEDCGSTANTPRLGAEMWAYVPYNLLPHLSCLTDSDYNLEAHKYYVDLRPRIFDVQIFNEETECTSDSDLLYEHPDCIHPKGWGTILVGGMRFGGSEYRPGSWEDDATGDVYAAASPFDNGILDYDNRDFTSAYFIFDITDPERVPTLLGEFTRTVDAAGVSSEVELGYTTVISTMVPMKRRDEAVSFNDTDCDGNIVDDPELSVWYLILGSGPTDLDGTSSQNGSVSIIPLDRFVSKVAADDKRDMRIPAATPAENTEPYPWNLPTNPSDGYPLDENKGYGTIGLPDPNSFISDMITVDMQIEQDYFADVVYFGTISGTWGGWGGKMYRIVTREECGTDHLQTLAQPSDWDLKLLLDAQKPITSSPTVGTDGSSFWVYFGTGRFVHDDDKGDSSSNALQTYYGIREPVDIQDCETLTWGEVSNMKVPFMLDPLDLDFDDPAQITDISTDPITTVPVDSTRGQLGLLPVTDIRVLSTPGRDLDQPDTLICKGDIGNLVSGGDTPLDPTDDIYEYTDTDCLPSTVLPSATIPYPGTRSFNNLINTTIGTSKKCGVGTMGTDGWYKDFPEDRERNLGQASLLSGLLNYTTYQPYEDICLAEGLSYLYSVFYQTGTAWVEDVFGTINIDSSPRQENPERIDLGAGLTTTPNIHVGRQEGGKVFVQTSTGRIVEIQQPNLPLEKIKSGRIRWYDIE